MNKKQIQIEVRTVYGVERIYVRSDHKEPISRLTGKSTLDQSDIEALKRLGFTFEQVTTNKLEV